MQIQQTNFNIVQSSQQIKCPAHQYNTIKLLNTTHNALKGERLLCFDCDPLRKQLIFFQKAQDILMQWYDQEVAQVTSLENTLDFQQFLKETQVQATEIHSKLLGSLMKKHKERLDKCFEKIKEKSGRISKFKKGFLELEKIMEHYLDKAKAQSELEPILRQLISDDPLTPEIVLKVGNLISLNLNNGVPSEKFQNQKFHELSLQKIKEIQEKVLKLLNGASKMIFKEQKVYKSQQIKYLPIIQKEQIKFAKKIQFLKCEQHGLPIEIINITPGKQIKTRGQCAQCDFNQIQFPQNVEELLFNWYQQEQNQINRYLDLLDKQQFIEKIMGQLEQAEFSYKQLVSKKIELAKQQYNKIQSEIQTWFDDLFQLCSANIKIYHEEELIKLKSKFFVTNFITRFNKPGEQISLEFMQDIAIFLSHNYLQDQGYVYRQFVKINQEIVDNMKQSINQFQIQNQQFIVNSFNNFIRCEFSEEMKHKDIQIIDGDTVKKVGFNDSIVFGEDYFEPPTESFRFALKIVNKASNIWLGVGANTNSSYQLCDDGDGHYKYMIADDKNAFHHSNSEVDHTTPSFAFDTGAIINISYDCFNHTLTFSKYQTQESYAMILGDQDFSKRLHPVVWLYGTGDTVQIMHYQD